ncbi:MAG: CopG family transcriptional regulator [Lachnospiraceae bacterium]|nr:CopG family transcriptional regulator [Lachnospiraceae bacterium]
MTISLRLNDTDSKIIKAYADIHGLSVSELVRRAILERIENEYDLKAFETAMAEYKANPVTYKLEDVAKELDLI